MFRVELGGLLQNWLCVSSPVPGMADASSRQDGCIRVAIRVRPADTENRGPCSPPPTGLLVDALRGVLQCGKTSFSFDSVYDEAANNEQIFDDHCPQLVRQVISGDKSTLMTYGASRSGKSFTMGEIGFIGTAREGVAHRTISTVFAEAAARAAGDHAFTFELAFVQIYLGQVRDLLGVDTYHLGQMVEQTLAVREDKKSGTFVAGARRHEVTSARRVFELLREGAAKLVVAATAPSGGARGGARSHACCQLFVTRKPAGGSSRSKNSHGSDDGAQKTGKLTLIDLAGAEDVRCRTRCQLCTPTALTDTLPTSSQHRSPAAHQ